MPGKHVHFLNGRLSDTPSPTFSSSTLPSSVGPITPPPLGSGSPYHCTPLPGAASVVPHYVFATGTSPIFFDLTTPPSPITVSQKNSLSPTFWADPATSPNIPFMEVQCAQLPWRITIYPQSELRKYITVGDVLEALYSNLRTKVLPAEYNQIPSESHKLKVAQAFERRCKRISDPTQLKIERGKGIRRVDFLGEHTTFNGLQCTMGDGTRWKLLVS